MRPDRGLEWGTGQDRRVRRRSIGVDVGAPRTEMTALEIAISAAAAFAPRGAEWDMPERAELEVAFEVSGERLALKLVSRSPDPPA